MLRRIENINCFIRSLSDSYFIALQLERYDHAKVIAEQAFKFVKEELKTPEYEGNIYNRLGISVDDYNVIPTFRNAFIVLPLSEDFKDLGIVVLATFDKHNQLTFDYYQIFTDGPCNIDTLNQLIDEMLFRFNFVDELGEFGLDKGRIKNSAPDDFVTHFESILKTSIEIE